MHPRSVRHRAEAGPYRAPPPTPAQPDSRRRADLESVGTLMFFCVACLVPVVASVAERSAFGAAESLGLIGATVAAASASRELALLVRERAAARERSTTTTGDR